MEVIVNDRIKYVMRSLPEATRRKVNQLIQLAETDFETLRKNAMRLANREGVYVCSVDKNFRMAFEQISERKVAVIALAQHPDIGAKTLQSPPSQMDRLKPFG